MAKLHAILSKYKGKVILWDIESVEQFVTLMNKIKPFWAYLYNSKGELLKEYRR